MIVTSTVYDRILAAAPHYPRQVLFYERLDRVATWCASFRPRAGEGGPVIKVYMLPAAGRRRR